MGYISGILRTIYNIDYLKGNISSAPPIFANFFTSNFFQLYRFRFKINEENKKHTNTALHHYNLHIHVCIWEVKK